MASKPGMGTWHESCFYGPIVSEVDRYLDGCEDLPSLPSVATQLLALSRSATATPVRAAHIVEADPVLVARVLRVVNSAAYGLRGDVVSVERAIALLGVGAVTRLAVGFTVVGQLEPGGAERKLHKLIWRHSVGAAAAARLLARRVMAPLADDLFLATLLADIGRLILLRADAPRYQQALASGALRAESLCECERRQFGFDHGELSAALLRRWSLPEAICALIDGHHDVSSPEGQLIEVAERMAELRSQEVDFEAIEAVSELANAALGLHLAAFSEIQRELRAWADELAQVFGVDAAPEPVEAPWPAFFLRPRAAR